MSKVNRQGRNVGEPRHVRLYDWMMKSAAWQSLDVYERALYVEFKARYNGTNNGDISFSGDEMAAAMNCSNRPADRALRTLMERGFVRLSRRGHFDWKRSKEGGSRSNTYILTEYGIDWPERSAMPPTKEFMKWRPEKSKSRGDVSTPMGGREHPIKTGMGGREHPNGGTSSPDKAPLSHMDGGTSSPAYRYTIGGSGRDA